MVAVRERDTFALDEGYNNRGAMVRGWSNNCRRKEGGANRCCVVGALDEQRRKKCEYV
jgi:hypothetical protein